MKEVIALGVFVGILMSDLLKVNTFQGIVGGQAEVGNFLAGDTTDRHLDIRSHPWRSFEFVLDDEADFVVVTDGMSFAEVDYVDAGHNCVGFR
jgi:hypothetical protein